MCFAFKFNITIQNLSKKGLQINFESDKKELSQLAKNQDLIAANSFIFDGHIKKDLNNTIELRGTITADVIQKCVITLEEVPTKIVEDFTITYLDKSLKPKYNEYNSEETITPEDAEDNHYYEYYTGNNIDIGPILEEIFSLTLPIYPRCETAPELFSHIEDSTEEKNIKNPFAILKKLK